jgi:dolichol-phosphate mannosyltransferase
LVNISIIIPTYNERENIAILVKDIRDQLVGYDYEIIIVDDNSPDGTGIIADKLAEKYRNIKVLHRPCKMGLASAIIDGLGKAEGDIISVLDADLQHPPSLLPKMIEGIKKGKDIVVASRYTLGGKIEGWSPQRRIVSKIAIALAHFLLPKTRKVKDPVSGYFSFKRSVITERIKPLGYKFLLEVLTEGKYDAVSEVPFTFKPRLRGKSKLGSKTVCDYIRQILHLSLKF